MAGYRFPICVDCGNEITNFKLKNKKRCTKCYDKRVDQRSLNLRTKKQSIMESE